MTQTRLLLPGVTLRACRDSRFKQGCLSCQLIRRMCAEEAAKNALLPAVLLRGTREYPDLRAITQRLDDLYGASVSPVVRRVGDYQSVGLYCGFIDDRFALPGEKVLAPMIEFLGELLLDYPTAGAGFDPEFVESEKRNLISDIESELNDKRVYAMGKLMKRMCRADSFGVPRLGEKEQVAAITPEALLTHYRRILRESPIEIFYVGSCTIDSVAGMLAPILQNFTREPVELPAQTPFHDGGGGDTVETMDVAQGKLCMGFVTPITNRDSRFAAMQMLNVIFGGGMTSKLFRNVREKMSLCYSIDSGYSGAKGIVTVSAGIDFEKETLVRQEILRQLDACQRGDITSEELESAREALLSGLRSVQDSPGAIEGYYFSNALGGVALTIERHMEAVAAVTAEDVVQAAGTLVQHSTYFLKGGV